MTVLMDEWNECMGAGGAGIMSDGEHEWQDRMGKAGGCNGLHNAGAVGGLRQQGYNLAWASGGRHGTNRWQPCEGWAVQAIFRKNGRMCKRGILEAWWL